jgi:UDP-glucose 4-epimerase
MKILLTGAEGFVGSRMRQSASFEFVPFSFSRGDLDAIDFSGIDAVVHLAALVHQMKGAEETEYFRINRDGTVALAKRAKRAGVKQFVFMSSVKVYGEENDLPYTESSLCHPTDPYGRSKLEAEQQLGELMDETFAIALIRSPLVYGEGVKANMLSLMRLVDRFALLPFGHLDNKRSMIYVGNLVHLIGEIVRQGKSGIFLAADNGPVSTTRLVESMAKAMGKELKLFSCPLLAGILKRLRPGLYRRLYKSLYVQNAKTVDALRLENPFTFDEGIGRMVAHFHQHQK